mmetsp:Transcript_15416/g.27700  ORF Transcript_15416/g.27700 Transcript_15416/m.27700 type:complete len:1137 (-) Transcript_15416:211-3621(-)
MMRNRTLVGSLIVIGCMAAAIGGVRAEATGSESSSIILLPRNPAEEQRPPPPPSQSIVDSQQAASGIVLLPRDEEEDDKAAPAPLDAQTESETKIDVTKATSKKNIENPEGGIVLLPRDEAEQLLVAEQLPVVLLPREDQAEPERRPMSADSSEKPVADGNRPDMKDSTGREPAEVSFDSTELGSSSEESNGIIGNDGEEANIGGGGHDNDKNLIGMATTEQEDNDAEGDGTTTSGGDSAENEGEVVKSERDLENSINYAGHERGAKIIHKSHGDIENAESILKQDMDRYMMCPCISEMALILQLSEAVWVDTIRIISLEYYAAGVEKFQLLGMPPDETTTVSIETAPDEHWDFLGEFQANQTRHAQTFTLKEPALSHHIKFRAVSWHPGESVCTLSSLGVYGETVHSKIIREMAEHDEEMESIRRERAQKAASAAANSQNMLVLAPSAPSSNALQTDSQLKPTTPLAEQTIYQSSTHTQSNTIDSTESEMNAKNAGESSHHNHNMGHVADLSATASVGQEGKKKNKDNTAFPEHAECNANIEECPVQDQGDYNNENNAVPLVLTDSSSTTTSSISTGKNTNKNDNSHDSYDNAGIVVIPGTQNQQNQQQQQQQQQQRQQQQQQPEWRFCATENETCAFNGTYAVRFGFEAEGLWTEETLTGPIRCTLDLFDDDEGESEELLRKLRDISQNIQSGNLTCHVLNAISMSVNTASPAGGLASKPNATTAAPAAVTAGGGGIVVEKVNNGNTNNANNNNQKAPSNQAKTTAEGGANGNDPDKKNSVMSQGQRGTPMTILTSKVKALEVSEDEIIHDVQGIRADVTALSLGTREVLSSIQQVQQQLAQHREASALLNSTQRLLRSQYDAMARDVSASDLQIEQIWKALFVMCVLNFALVVVLVRNYSYSNSSTKNINSSYSSLTERDQVQGTYLDRHQNLNHKRIGSSSSNGDNNVLHRDTNARSQVLSSIPSSSSEHNNHNNKSNHNHHRNGAAAKRKKITAKLQPGKAATTPTSASASSSSSSSSFLSHPHRQSSSMHRDEADTKLGESIQRQSVWDMFAPRPLPEERNRNRFAIIDTFLETCHFIGRVLDMALWVALIALVLVLLRPLDPGGLPSGQAPSYSGLDSDVDSSFGLNAE